MKKKMDLNLNVKPRAFLPVNKVVTADITAVFFKEKYLCKSGAEMPLLIVRVANENYLENFKIFGGNSIFTFLNNLALQIKSEDTLAEILNSMTQGIKNIKLIKTVNDNGFKRLVVSLNSALPVAEE